MKGKWVVVFLIHFWIEDGVLTGPVGLFEREPRADILNNATVRGQAERPLQPAVGPNRICEPIDGAVHCMEIDDASRGSVEELRVQRGWIVDAELLGGNDAQPGKTADNQLVVRWTSKGQVPVFQRLQIFRW